MTAVAVQAAAAASAAAAEAAEAAAVAAAATAVAVAVAVAEVVASVASNGRYILLLVAGTSWTPTNSHHTDLTRIARVLGEPGS